MRTRSRLTHSSTTTETNDLVGLNYSVQYNLFTQRFYIRATQCGAHYLMAFLNTLTTYSSTKYPQNTNNRQFQFTQIQNKWSIP
jgi:hypothetical protein